MSIETFASPGLRWGLLLVDHPMATHSYEMCKGTEIGIPASYGGNGDFCVCTITIPGQTPIVASKGIKSGGQPDDWQVIKTKTLGRALKVAGYPDDMKDLKALVLWRQRQAEIEAISAGHAGALERVAKPLEIEAGGKDADDDGIIDVDEDGPEANLSDEPIATVTNVTNVTYVQQADEADPQGYETDSDVVDAETVEDEPAPALGRDEARFEKVFAVVKGLSKPDKADLKVFLADNNIPPLPADWGDGDLDDIDAWLDEG